MWREDPAVPPHAVPKFGRRIGYEEIRHHLANRQSHPIYRPLRIAPMILLRFLSAWWNTSRELVPDELVETIHHLA